MPTLRALEKRHAERVAMARTLLEQRASMQRMNLSPVEWVCFRLGCSIAEGERLVQEVEQPGLTEKARRILKRIEKDDEVLNDRREYTVDDFARMYGVSQAEAEALRACVQQHFRIEAP